MFRRIWLASLLSNLGLMIQGVGAAWAMTQMTSSADKVALVQTALMLPIMLISMPAGAIADMYDRRIVALVSLMIALAGATALAVLAWSRRWSTPDILLAFCFVVGSGMALFGPAWQSSVSEQVPAETLPSAVALNGISYNIARSFGPAIGGIVVATAGAVAAFAANALLYLPLLVVLFLWKPRQRTVAAAARTAQPRHRLGRALHRQFAVDPHRADRARWSPASSAARCSALMPLVARDLLHGGAQTYGIMLGAFGMGAVIGALNIGEVRKRHRAARPRCAPARCRWRARSPRSRSAARRSLTAAALVIGRRGVDAGGRAVQHRRAAVGAALGRRPLAGGVPGLDRRRHRDRQLGLGPRSTDLLGVETALLVSAGLMLASPLLGLWLRMPPVGAPQRGCRGARRSRGAAVADRAQRAAGGRDRIPRRPGRAPAPSTM